MRKTYLFLILLAWLSACTSDSSETSETGTQSSQSAILKGAENDVSETDMGEMGAETSGKNQLIVPGKSIGLIKLNEQAEVVYKLLGKPNQTDAGMGKMLATWFTEPNLSDPDTADYKTNIFFVRNMGGSDESALTKQIRITSEDYKLENRIGIGSGLETIQPRFPEMKKVATYPQAATQKPVTIYLDAASGIAFEINDQKKCVGIGIQEPGKANLEVYSAVSSKLKKL